MADREQEILNEILNSSPPQRRSSIRYVGPTAGLPQPPSWEARRRELEALYHAEFRLAKLGGLGVRGAKAVIDLDEYINSKGPLPEAVETLLRDLEVVVGRAAAQLIIRAMLEE